MTLWAARSGVTIIDEDAWNSQLMPDDVEMIYTGSSVDAKTGAGVAEFDCASYDHCGSFTLTGVTELSRIEFNLAGDGDQADLTLEIRSGMDPAAGDDGTLLKSITIPASWIPATAAVISVPVGLTGLTAGATYWWRIQKAGDATDHFHLVGETSQDGSYPAYYRAAASGNWTLENSIQFTVYSGESTSDDLLFSMGDAFLMAFSYAYGLLASIKYAVWAVDGTLMINKTYTLTRSGTIIKRGVAS